MLHMVEQALEHEQTSAPAHCLAMMGRSADRVIYCWQRNPEGFAAVRQDVGNHNAAFDRSATVHSHFRALVRPASAAAAAAAPYVCKNAAGRPGMLYNFCRAGTAHSIRHSVLSGFSQACLMLQAALQLQKEQAEQVAVAMQSFLMDFRQLHIQRRTCLAALQEASQLVPALLVSG